MALIRLKNAFENYKKELILKAKIFVEEGFLEKLKQLYIKRKSNEIPKNTNVQLECARESRNTAPQTNSDLITDTAPIKRTTFSSGSHSTEGHISYPKKRPVEIERVSHVKLSISALNENPTSPSERAIYVPEQNEKANSGMVNDKTSLLFPGQLKTSRSSTQKRNADLLDREKGQIFILIDNDHKVNSDGSHNEPNSTDSAVCNINYIPDEKKILYPVPSCHSVPPTRNNQPFDDVEANRIPNS